MILLSLQGIQKSFGTNEVLRDASLVLQDGQRMGLVGVNGCGKSTLMKIIAGIETADGGTMTMQKGLKLGYLAQQGQVGEGRTVLEELESVFEPVQRMEQQLRDLEHQMADAHDEASLHRLGSQYDQLTRRFEESNGYGWRSTVQGVLAGLGFRKEQQEQMASLLSGGERTRLCLGRMLLTEPDVLLLDEPTTTLTSSPSPGWRIICAPTAARCCSSAMTAISWITFATACASCSLARRSAMTAIIPPTWCSERSGSRFA